MALIRTTCLMPMAICLKTISTISLAVGGVWQVYYSERGHKWDYREFNSESDACEYLWNLLEKDETIWR
jgi:hypothetical protein